MIYSDIPSAQQLVLTFQAKGIRNIVISPGSRNAPLTLSFAKQSYFNCYSIVDERCAGFFAMGMARQLQEPVAVLCTSGSAVLNYYPAVAEAYYSEVPLVVVSADRPAYKIDVGDGQTIRQTDIFQKHIGFSANLKQDVSHAPEVMAQFDKTLLVHTQQEIQAYNQFEILKALEVAMVKRLPVHINVPFEEPLYGRTNNLKVVLPSEEDALPGLEKLDDLEYFSKIWSSSSKKMVLIGVAQPDTLAQDVLEKLGADTTVVVFTETTSNVHHDAFFPSIDSIIAPIEKSENKEALFKALQPDLLLTVGGMIVSKKIKAFLRQYNPKVHWHVGQNRAYDTFFCLERHAAIEPTIFFKSLVSPQAPEQGYRMLWDGVKANYEQRREAYLNKIGYSDFSVFHQLQMTIPKHYQVHLANSSTVRYTQLFPMDASLSVYCNRGTSGIDGSTATAVGASVHHDSPTLLITGDLSFLYDSNGLWFKGMRSDFRIININNNGGGIFRILPGKEDTIEFSSFFETVHELTAEHLAAMFGFEYLVATNANELQNALESFYTTSEKPKILEVFTPRLENDQILLEYFDFIS